MHQSLIIVDDFFNEPLEVREQALSCDYPEADGPLTFPGRNSSTTFLPTGLDQVMSTLAAEVLIGCPRPEISHGKFRITQQDDPSRYLVHVDPSFLSWVGVIYLSLPEHCRGGTAFYRHKGLNSDRTPPQAVLEDHGFSSIAELLQQDGRDPDRWDLVMTVPMRFNRLVFYRPWMWHSAAEAFGQSKIDARLVYLLFFEAASRAAPRASGGARG